MNPILKMNNYGQKIWVDTKSHVGKTIIEKGIYDENALYYLTSILQKIPHAICLDIGAHLGNHALVMTLNSDMVYCFEPDNLNANLLKKNKEENNIQNMQIFNFGLSDQNEELTFYHNSFRGRSTFVSALKEKNCSEEIIKCRVGDELLAELNIQKIDFIKIDIEGFEARALQGLKNTITQYKPILMMEWNNENTKVEFKKYNLFATIFNDYQIYSILYNHHKYYWGNHWSGKISRFFYRKFVNKKTVLHLFDAEKNYRNILLCPTEKKWVLEQFIR